MNDDILITGIMVAVSVIFILLTGTLGTLFLAHRNRLRQQANLAAARLSYEQELRTIATEVSEQTLATLSSELHDNIGGHLTLLRIQLETYGLQNPAAAHALLPAADTLTEAVSQVRLLSHSLNADMLDGAGLRGAIAKEAARLQGTGRTAVHFEDESSDPDAGLTPDARLVAFRIFQEAVSNALKHARPKNLFIVLRAAPHFQLRVADDGAGFDPNAVRRADGAGLSSMEKRAAMAGLQCSIQSAPGRGTVVLLTMTAADGRG